MGVGHTVQMAVLCRACTYIAIDVDIPRASVLMCVDQTVQMVAHYRAIAYPGIPRAPTLMCVDQTVQMAAQYCKIACFDIPRASVLIGIGHTVQMTV